MKICTIGCGGHSQCAHAPSFKKYAELYPDTILAACCDLNEERARAYMCHWGFERYYTDLDKMLDCEKPDAVCLIAPESLTAFLAEKVLEKGYPLILEKPPGRTLEELRHLIEVAEKKKVPNMVAFNRRYHPVIKSMKGILSNNFTLKDIHNIRYEMYRVNRREDNFWATAIHGIDVVRYIAGADYQKISFHYQELPEIGTGVCNFYMDCTFTTGATAQLSFCPVSGKMMENMTIHLLDHSYFLDIKYGTSGSLVHYQCGQITDDAGLADISYGNEDFDRCGYYQENEEFFNIIRAGRIPEGDLKTAAQSVEIAECVANRVPEYIISGGKINGKYIV
jgi:predicted dehydrogenase